MSALLPRATLADVVLGRAPLVGSRLDPEGPRGFFSPVEARVSMGIPYGDLRREEAAALDAGMSPGALARAVWAAGWDGAEDADEPIPLVSTVLDPMSIEEATAALLTPTGDRARLAYLVHPHCLNLALLDRDHRARLARADLRLPDGIGLRLGARIVGRKIGHNLCGTDLVPHLLPQASDAGPVVLLGGKPGVAQACAARWEQERGASIALCEHGYLDDEGIAAFRSRVRALGGGLLLAGMGSPVQERFAETHLADLEGWTVLTVGGLFDYFAGDVERAPLAWRELGLEWLWRMRQEPRRLAARYLLGNPLFVSAALAQRAGMLRPEANPEPARLRE